MADLPQQGQPLPEIDLTAEDGSRLGRDDLAGQRTVLSFYPKDDTPVCTEEACAFRDRMGDYGEAGIKVYGVSLDSPESHREVRAKRTRTCPLPAAGAGRAAEALGVRRDNGAVANRVTFLLAPDGNIAKVYPEVSPETHADEILDDAGSI